MQGLEAELIAHILLEDLFKRAEEKGIKLEVTEKFTDRWGWGRGGGQGDGVGVEVKQVAEMLVESLYISTYMRWGDKLEVVQQPKGSSPEVIKIQGRVCVMRSGRVVVQMVLSTGCRGRAAAQR